MPEGDTVHVAARRLNERLAGDVLTASDLRVPSLATVDLTGRKMLEVVARGKHVLMRIEGGVTLHSHFKMDGAWHIYRPGQRWRGPGFQIRAVLATERVSAVGFRLAILELLDTDRELDVVGHLGPDPLGDDWNRARAAANLNAWPERSISEALLDQRVVAGVGNVYRCELCFLLGAHPDAPVGEVDVDRLATLIERTLRANRRTGYQVTTGDDRRGRRHWVYGRSRESCRRCGGPIERMEEGESPTGRVTYWCPLCQPNHVDRDRFPARSMRVPLASIGVETTATADRTENQ